MAVELLRRGLLDHRRALVGWCLGMMGYAALVASIFPSIKGSADFKKLVEQYPDALKSLFGLGAGGDITSGAGYMDAELFSLILPLLVLVLAIGSGARTFAGEEDRGLLELGLSYPVRRRDAVLAKGAALAGEVVAVCASALAALVVLNWAVGLDLSFWRLAAALGAVGALGLIHGWLALGIGPRSRAACSRSAFPPRSRRPVTSSAASISSPAGSIPSGSSRPSGSSARRRFRRASTVGEPWPWSLRPAVPWRSARRWSTGATSRLPDRRE